MPLTKRLRKFALHGLAHGRAFEQRPVGRGIPRSAGRTALDGSRRACRASGRMSSESAHGAWRPGQKPILLMRIMFSQTPGRSGTPPLLIKIAQVSRSGMRYAHAHA